jgi:hypothetical protein
VLESQVPRPAAPDGGVADASAAAAALGAPAIRRHPAAPDARVRAAAHAGGAAAQPAETASATDSR